MQFSTGWAAHFLIIILWSPYDHMMIITWSYGVSYDHVVIIVSPSSWALMQLSSYWDARSLITLMTGMRASFWWECFWSRWWRGHGENEIIDNEIIDNGITHMIITQRLAESVSIIQTGEMFWFVLITSMKQHLTVYPWYWFEKQKQQQRQ